MSRSTSESGGDQIFATLSVLQNRCASQRRGPERGSVSCSTLRATYALDLSERWAADGAPAGHRLALLWLRLRRALPYRRFLTCQLVACEQRSADYKSAIRQNKNLRYAKHLRLLPLQPQTDAKQVRARLVRWQISIHNRFGFDLHEHLR